ncbi:DUF2793 domain-containing protein [Stappia sp.]|uniref:DUF2793 domain-containing protein n=1 Tax=Stappia sp. TaxID=1870903 RepID=UPI003A9902C4
MDETANHKLPLIRASQAQKHVTHNEALLRLDAIMQLSVLSRTQSTPPAASEGERYLVPVGGSGAWAANDGRIAIWQGGVWRFLEPGRGWICHVEDEELFLVRTADGWEELTAASRDPVLAGKAGINATPDDTNRLAVSSESSLFTHAGGSHRLKIDKSSPSETASAVFQSGLSGRAEIGLAGNDDLSIKVSADGSSWKNAIIIDGDTSAVGIGTVPFNDVLDVNGGIVSRAQAPAFSFLGDIDGAKWITGLGGYFLSFMSDNGNSQAIPERSSITCYGRTFRPKIAFTTTGSLLAAGALKAQGYRSGEIELADDASAAIAPLDKAGFLLVSVDPAADHPPLSAFGIAAYDSGTSPEALKLAGGALFDAVSSDVTGTSGIDGHVTIGVVAGSLRIENRLGAMATLRYTFLG